MTSAGLRFAAVMVPNQGVQARAWWWYFGIDANAITGFLKQNNARLVSLRPYTEGGVRKYVVIMISNTNQDFKPFEWYINTSPEFIKSRITTGQRLISMAPGSNQGWDVIFDFQRRRKLVVELWCGSKSNFVKPRYTQEPSYRCV